MSHGVDAVLADHIMLKVCEAANPIVVGRGPGYDKRLKQALGVVGFNKSVVCGHVKQLVEAGKLKVEPTDVHTVFLGERTREYDVVAILPVEN